MRCYRVFRSGQVPPMQNDAFRVAQINGFKLELTAAGVGTVAGFGMKYKLILHRPGRSAGCQIGAHGDQDELCETFHRRTPYFFRRPDWSSFIS